MSERAKILIVDDEPFNVDYLEQELEDLGYEIISATSGQEALSQVAEKKPDLVLLDIMMPGMDGFEVCRTLKGDEDTRLIPIIFMTALGAVEDRIKGIEAGADDFLTRPVDERELRARIKTALKLKQAIERKIGKVGRVQDRLGGHQVFVSYPSEHAAVATAIFNELTIAGFSCWMAPKSVPAGSTYASSITEAIEKSQVMILVCAAATNESEHCESEVGIAHDRGVKILPFRIENVRPSKSLEYYLSKRHWMDAFPGRMEEHIHQLPDTLRDLIEGATR